MDLSTGEIMARERAAQEAMETGHPFIPIDLIDATPKQTNLMRVSLKDHRSTLGRKLTEERNARSMDKNHRRILRRAGKLR